MDPPSLPVGRTLVSESLPEIVGGEGSWDPKGCPFCGSRKVKAGPEMNGTRPYVCRDCAKTYEAVVRNGKPVSRVLDGTGESTRGFRIGDGMENGRFLVPAVLPCGCRVRTSGGYWAKRGNRIKHPLLANGDRLCTRHNKRFRLALVFEEARA